MGEGGLPSLHPASAGVERRSLLLIWEGRDSPRGLPQLELKGSQRCVPSKGEGCKAMMEGHDPCAMMGLGHKSSFGQSCICRLLQDLQGKVLCMG